MAAQPVKVEGLSQFAREMRKLEHVDAKELNELNKSAAELVIDHAQVRARGVSRQAAAAATSLKALKQASKAVIKIGGNRRTGPQAFALGAEFGSKRYGQFPAWRGSGDNAGYFVWPSIRDARTTDDMLELYGKGIEQLVSKAFPKG